MFGVLKTAALAAAFSLLALPAKAAVLLTVDVSDPSMVTFTATGAASEADAATDSVEGFSLLDFFTSTRSLGIGTITGTLTSVQGDAPVTNASAFSLNTALNLYDGFDTGSFVFEAGETAFSGSVTLDLSAFADLLPAAGSMGRIAIGSSFRTGPFGSGFGDYLVVNTVPLPAAAPLMVLGLIGLRTMRRRA